MLGVSFTNTMSFAPHVMNVVNKTASSLYALKTLKAHAAYAVKLYGKSHEQY